jgi:hypothetical protein
MTKIRLHLLCLMMAAVSLLSACGDDHDHDHDHADGHAAHDHEGPNGGHIYELGAVGHLEFVHDVTTGRVTMYFTGPDLKKPITPDQPPELKLSTDSGPLVLSLKSDASPDSSRFSVTNDALKTEHPKGRISIKVAGAVFNPDLEDPDDH